MFRVSTRGNSGQPVQAITEQFDVMPQYVTVVMVLSNSAKILGSRTRSRAYYAMKANQRVLSVSQEEIDNEDEHAPTPWLVWPSSR